MSDFTIVPLTGKKNSESGAITLSDTSFAFLLFCMNTQKQLPESENQNDGQKKVQGVIDEFLKKALDLLNS